MMSALAHEARRSATGIMKEKWTHFATCSEGQPVLIDGVDIWKHKWMAAKLRANVRDPIHGQDYVFHVYTVDDGGRQLEFAAGEFSNSVWGIFISEKN